MIRSATRHDAESISRIYQHYILNTIITFEEEIVTPDEFAERIGAVQSAGLPWLIIEEAGSVMGYAYASKWRARPAYRFCVETSVYLDTSATSRRLGTQLYEALLTKLREKKMHVALGGIALPNAGSVALHERLGFQKVAHYQEVGFKFNQWIDVGSWQLIL